MKHLPNNDAQFYPTPKRLQSIMLDKINHHRDNYKRILDPSAGKGDLLKPFLGDDYKRSGVEVYAIEIDTNLQKILRAEKIRLVDSDFLAHNGIDKYDLIIMNPPFKDGDKHLLHALDFVIDGQIVCVLNAETIKNPYSNTRKDLLQRLTNLNADISFHENMFMEGERQTGVEIALISIKIENTAEQLFNPKKFEHDNADVILDDKQDLKIHGKVDINDLISDYQREKEQGVKCITTFFHDSYGLRSELQLFVKGELEHNGDNGRFTADNYKPAIQRFSRNLKTTYWNNLIRIPKFEERLTLKAKEQFYTLINDYKDMEFNENNINVLYEHLLSFSANLIEECIDTLFDDITSRFSYYTEMAKNIYLYNGWKTNNGYKINKKFILPMRDSHWCVWLGGSWKTRQRLDDIEKVFTFFNNGRVPEVAISSAYEKWFKNKSNEPFENELFMIRVYKKGTAHITVKDESLLRRFNVYVGRKKQWLPPDYATKTYDNCSFEEKNVIDEFEGETKYTANLNDPLLLNANKPLLMIGAA